MAWLVKFSCCMCVGGTLFLPETYPPVRFRDEAGEISPESGRHDRGTSDVGQGKSATQSLYRAIIPGGIVLLHEPMMCSASSVYGVHTWYGSLCDCIKLQRRTVALAEVRHRGWRVASFDQRLVVGTSRTALNPHANNHTVVPRHLNQEP